MGNKVVIFGATEMALLSHYYLTHDSPYEVIAFTVNRNFIEEQRLCGLPVTPFEDIESVYPPSEYKMFVATWFGRVNKTRAEMYSQVKAKGYELISYVSSKAITWPDLVVGDNSIISESTVINPFAEIGSNVFLSPGSVIGHHSIIMDHCFVATHAVVLGSARIEPYCFLGANSTILQKVNVARECIIGAGVTIAKNTKERAVYVDKPAQMLSKPSNVLSAWLTWPSR